MLGRVCALAPRAAQGVGAALTCGHMQGTAGYQDPLEPVLQNNPHLPRSPSWLNILRLYRNPGLTHASPAGPAAAAGEVLEFPARPDSARSSSTFLPPLECGLWNPSGRKPGVFPSGPVVIPRTRPQSQF